MFTTIKTIVHNATKPVKIAYNVKCMNKGCYYNTTVTSKPLKKNEQILCFICHKPFIIINHKET